MIREIEVSTTIQPYEDLNLVVDSVRSFFPDWDPDLPSRDDGFPSNNSHEIIHGFSSSLDLFLDAIRRQSILDTALDAMAMDGITVSASSRYLDLRLWLAKFLLLLVKGYLEEV